MRPEHKASRMRLFQFRITLIHIIVLHKAYHYPGK